MIDHSLVTTSTVGIELTSSATVPGCLANTFHEISLPADCIGDVESGMMIQFTSVSRYERSVDASEPTVSSVTYDHTVTVFTRKKRS